MKPQAKTFNSAVIILSPRRKSQFQLSRWISNRDPLDFTETLELPAIPQDLNEKSLQKFLESLSLILGISYYKLYCPPKIKLFSNFRKNKPTFGIQFIKSLGEFLYRNNLDPEKLAKFPYSKYQSPAATLGC